jgi:hypothetical protein
MRDISPAGDDHATGIATELTHRDTLAAEIVVFVGLLLLGLGYSIRKDAGVPAES